MHSFSRSLLGLGALTLAGCGAPAELDESRFPGVGDTGYEDGVGPIGSAGSGGALPPPSTGTGGTGPSAPVGGGGSVGQGGSAPAAMGGSGSVSAGGNPPIGQAGQQGAQGGSASGGGSEPPGDDACPDDITELFARPGPQGGCDGPGCHSAGGQRPDLLSPGLEERLLDVASSAQCRGIPYVSAGESLLEGKIAGSPAPCGLSMPLGGRMTPEDQQCVINWIAEVTGG